MGRGSSHETKKVFDLPPQVFNTRHLSCFAFFALDFLGWKCLRRHQVGYPAPRFGNCYVKINLMNLHVYTYYVATGD